MKDDVSAICACDPARGIVDGIVHRCPESTVWIFDLVSDRLDLILDLRRGRRQSNHVLFRVERIPPVLYNLIKDADSLYIVDQPNDRKQTKVLKSVQFRIGGRQIVNGTFIRPGRHASLVYRRLCVLQQTRRVSIAIIAPVRADDLVGVGVTVHIGLSVVNICEGHAILAIGIQTRIETRALALVVDLRHVQVPGSKCPQGLELAEPVGCDPFPFYVVSEDNPEHVGSLRDDLQRRVVALDSASDRTQAGVDKLPVGRQNAVDGLCQRRAAVTVVDQHGGLQLVQVQLTLDLSRVLASVNRLDQVRLFIEDHRFFDDGAVVLVVDRQVEDQLIHPTGHLFDVKVIRV